MAVANRTLSVPVNIWADHQDTLVLRDSGWIQLYTGSVQEIYDLLLCAFKIAEDEAVCLPCLVSYDGFILSHASEPIRTLTQEQVDAFLPSPGSTGRPVLDPAEPLQFGEVLFPEWYPDFEYKKHRALADALDVVRRVTTEYAEVSGRHWTPVDAWGCDDAEVVLLGIGSMMQTARHTAQRLRREGRKVGVVNVRLYRPFPDADIRRAVGDASRVLVLDRDIGYGTSGMVFADVTRALFHQDHRPTALNFIIGTGGKDITPATIERCIQLADQAPEGQTEFWPDARGPAEGVAYS
jgi:pyruvate ferredoxin oxidoreductase alpha subunit